MLPYLVRNIISHNFAANSGSQYQNTVVYKK